jgi:PAS domain S-box-containing protein
VRPRHIAPVALTIGLAVAGFFGARLLGERDARLDSERRAEVAAAQIRGRVEQAASLAESLRRAMAGSDGRAVTTPDFERTVSRYLSPAGFPAAAWAERVPASQRATYERRTGHPVVTRDRRGRLAPAGSRSSYLPATLVSGTPPISVPGTDLGGEPGVAAALSRASTLYDAAATPLATLRDGTMGLFLIRLGPRFTPGGIDPGFVVVFASEQSLRAAATDTDGLELTAGGRSTADGADTATVRRSFMGAGQRFDVVVPQESVHGAGAVLPWIILGAGLVLAALAGALGVNAARRAKAQADLDRTYRLSPDLIAVADFEGHFTRVNPAVEQILGYTPEEFLAQPYLELVHPEDREKTVAEASAIEQGKTTLSFENRYVHKDGSHRMLQWTSTPVVEDRLMYGVARDVTERRQAEAEVERLAGEQAALRRVATLVAEEAPTAELFAKVAEEAATALGDADCALLRDEGDGTGTVVGLWGRRAGEFRGTRLSIEGDSATMVAIREARPGRVDDYSAITDDLALRAAELGMRSAVACPIVVRGRVWGAIGVVRYEDAEPFAADAEERLAQFADLVATAIANADTRDQLTASRARLVTAGDEARRRVVRDLHDGAQQWLVHNIITLKLARRALRENGEQAESLVAEALGQAERANAELRELAHGLLPATLTRGGLRAGVDSVVERLDLPVETDVPAERLPAEIEASAYFIVAEALTNVVKHAQATRAEVKASVEDGMLRVEVHDDGLGGANPDGHGLLGLHDRATALGGRLEIESPDRGGTMVTATLPLRSG